ncbi:MAG: HAD hydrolase family protein [Rhodoferax sp.]|nr:HAD hydrolase family protein [Rhodoferax sp.]
MQQPTLAYPAQLLLKAQGIRVAFFDVDGVLTDGGLYFSASGETIKRFHVLDGHGIRSLQAEGITPVVITGRDAKALRVRLKALGIAHAFFGVDDKHAAARSSLRKLKLDWQQAAVIGDDWPDLALVQRCRFSAAPSNAHPEVLASVDHVTQRSGGQGAAREFCDLLLMACGAYARLLAKARA